MTDAEALLELRELQFTGDPENAHSLADDVLCRFLKSLGYDSVVKEWDKVEKWYA